LLFIDAFEFDERAHRSYDHSLDDFHPACETRFVVGIGLPALVVPNLTIGAFTVPAKITVRDRVKREELEASEDAVLFGDCDLFTQDFDGDEPLVGFQQIVIDRR